MRSSSITIEKCIQSNTGNILGRLVSIPSTTTIPTPISTATNILVNHISSLSDLPSFTSAILVLSASSSTSLECLSVYIHTLVGLLPLYTHDRDLERREQIHQSIQDTCTNKEVMRNVSLNVEEEIVSGMLVQSTAFLESFITILVDEIVQNRSNRVLIDRLSLVWKNEQLVGRYKHVLDTFYQHLPIHSLLSSFIE